MSGWIQAAMQQNISYPTVRVSVQGVKSLGGHFACLCWGFDFYEVKNKILLFFKKKREILIRYLGNRDIN